MVDVSVPVPWSANLTDSPACRACTELPGELRNRPYEPRASASRSTVTVVGGSDVRSGGAAVKAAFHCARVLALARGVPSGSTMPKSDPSIGADPPGHHQTEAALDPSSTTWRIMVSQIAACVARETEGLPFARTLAPNSAHCTGLPPVR